MTLEEIKGLPTGTILKFKNDETDFVKKDEGLYCYNYSSLIKDSMMVWELVDILKDGFRVEGK